MRLFAIRAALDCLEDIIKDLNLPSDYSAPMALKDARDELDKVEAALLNPKSPGQTAYEIYSSYTNGAPHAWTNLDSQTKDAWERTAQVIKEGE